MASLPNVFDSGVLKMFIYKGPTRNTRDCDELGIPKLMNAAKCQGYNFFTVSELRKNQRGTGGGGVATLKFGLIFHNEYF